MKTHALVTSFLLLVWWLLPAAAQAQPTVQFEDPKSDFVERSTEGKVWVVMSQPSAARVTVPFIVLGGTATRGVSPVGETDFILADGVVAFEPGQVEKAIDLTVVDDSTTEPIETVILLLGAPSAGVLGPKGVHVYSIYDDDRQEHEQEPPPPPNPVHNPPPPPPPPVPPPSVVGFASVESSARENAGPGSMLVRRSGPARAVTVQYRVTGGTATSGDDYVLAAGQVTIPEGQETVSIPVGLQDDPRDEPDETVTVLLETPSAGAQLGLAGSTFRIIDDDVVALSFAQPASSTGEAASPARVEVRLSTEASRAVTFLVVGGGTATGGGVDYGLAATPVTVEAGLTSVFISLPIANDTLVEGNETAELALVAPTNARLGAATKHTLTITDDDRVLPVVRFDTASTNAVEGVAARQFDVVLESKFDEEVTVTVARTAGTADDADYALAGGVVTFAPGETRKSVVLTVTDDLVEEADETVDIELSNPINARLDQLTRHTHWILDDDAAGEDLVFYRQEILTTDDFRRLVIIGPKTQNVTVGGLAIDPNGNVYVSDQGIGPNSGAILMLPKGRRNVLRILTGLNLPTDIELTPDGRGIVIAGADGELTRHAFGLSLKLTGAGALGPATRVVAQTDTGATRPVSVSPDGYFHIPEILTNGQVSNTVTLIVEHRGVTKTYPNVPLGSPGGAVDHAADQDAPAPAVVGHTVIQLDAPQGQ